MASPMDIAQQIFSQVLQISSPKSAIDPSTYQCINGTPVLVPTKTSSSSFNEAVAGAGAATQGHPSPSLVDFFFTSTALMEWFKIFVYGSLLAMFRRLIYFIFGRIYDSFFITARFEEEDVSYIWVSFWLSRQPAWRSARKVEVLTEVFDLTCDMIEGEMEDTIHNGTRQLAYLPAEGTVHSMWYKNHWMQVRRFTTERGPKNVRHIELRLLARSHTVLNNILIQSKKEYEEAKNILTSLCVPSRGGNMWREISSCTKRPLSSVILDPGVKNMILSDASHFLANRTWYVARGIPCRRGYLLYGPPGSGKTSLIHSIAGELGLGMYNVSLSKSGTDDASLNELFNRLPEKCIALMEDIDAAFGQTLNRQSNNTDSPDSDSDSNSNSSDSSSSSSSNNRRRSTKTTHRSRITLSGLLNALDGVGAQEGRILFATTNRYDALDPALCRPGRMDVHVEFKNASRYQAVELFKFFYMPPGDESGEAVIVRGQSEGEREGEREPHDGEGSENSESEGEKEKSPLLLLPPPKLQELWSTSTTTSTTAETKSDDDDPRPRPRPRLLLSVAQLDKLAEEFADKIPQGEFSMASLQGYLIGHKVTPWAAVQQVAGWVAKEREAIQKRKERRKDGKRKGKKKKDEKNKKKKKDEVEVEVEDEAEAEDEDEDEAER